MEQLVHGSTMEGLLQDSLFNTLARAIRIGKRRPQVLMLAIEICRMMWNERNAAAFSQQYNRMPPYVILKNLQQKVKAIEDCAFSTKKLKKLQRASKEMQEILQPWNRELQQIPAQLANDCENQM